MNLTIVSYDKFNIFFCVFWGYFLSKSSFGKKSPTLPWRRAKDSRKEKAAAAKADGENFEMNPRLQVYFQDRIGLNQEQVQHVMDSSVRIAQRVR